MTSTSRLWLLLHAAGPRQPPADRRQDDVEDNNCYDDDDDGQLEVLHTHGSGKVPAGSFESD